MQQLKRFLIAFGPSSIFKESLRVSKITLYYLPTCNMYRI